MVSVVELDSQFLAALASPVLDGALACRSLHTGKETVSTSSLALFRLVCCRHDFLTTYKHIINIF
jgi:hypothetical protein